MIAFAAVCANTSFSKHPGRRESSALRADSDLIESVRDVLTEKSDQIASSLRAERRNPGPNALKLDCFVAPSRLLAMTAPVQLARMVL
jgi:hypothetical protein